MRNPMLNTPDGAKRYYAYQREYHKTHTKRISFVVMNGKDAALIEALDEVPARIGQTKNSYLREAVVEKLTRDGLLNK